MRDRIFALAREEVPLVFYTPKLRNDLLGVMPGQVLAINVRHDIPGWICAGFVCRQTPFGQGTYMGFRPEQLRPATPEEIVSSLQKDHPHGFDFRPSKLSDLTPDDFSGYDELMVRWDEITALQRQAILSKFGRG